MTDYYVDSNSGDNGDTGLTQALAWATIEYAVESGSLVAGDIVWVRRTHVEYSIDPTSDITPAYSGTRNSLIEVIGWARAAIANTVITSATWVNGSTTVDLVVGATLSRGVHCGRWITAPNGSKFLITQITDSNTLIIDREYSGTGVSGTDGKFQIEADEDYSSRPADVDGWDSDADALPVIDFRDTGYRIYLLSYNYWAFKNLEIRDSGNTMIAIISQFTFLQGCLLLQSNNNGVLASSSGVGVTVLIRCILEGTGTGSGQYGVSIGDRAAAIIKDSSIYNLGDRGLFGCEAYLENVNIGVEAVNDIDLQITKTPLSVIGRDVKLGSPTKVDFSTSDTARGFMKVSFENYGKVLGKHKTFLPGIIYESYDVVAGSGDPYKRSSGADKILQVDCSISSTLSPGMIENGHLLFEHEFETDATSKSYRYYVNCKALSLTASELWLEVEYVDSYDDTSEYTITKAESDETCALRGSVSDWTQYIEVTGIAPAVASKVRIKCFVAKYDADGYIYIDPLAVVS